MANKINLNSIWNFVSSAKGVSGMMKDKDQKWSSKRTAGLALIGLGINALTNAGFNSIYEFGGYIIVIGLGTLLLSMTVSEKGNKPLG